MSSWVGQTNRFVHNNSKSICPEPNQLSGKRKVVKRIPGQCRIHVMPKLYVETQTVN